METFEIVTRFAFLVGFYFAITSKKGLLVYFGLSVIWLIAAFVMRAYFDGVIGLAYAGLSIWQYHRGRK
jgi:hypothetical protein